MYEASLKSNEAHQEFIKLRREQNQEYRALKKTKKQEEDVLAKLAASNPALEGIHPNPKSVKEFQKNAKLLQRSINEQYSSKHELRREIGSSKHGSVFRRKNREERIAEVHETIVNNDLENHVHLKSTSMRSDKRHRVVDQFPSTSSMLCSQKAALQA